MPEFATFEIPFPVGLALDAEKGSEHAVKDRQEGDFFAGFFAHWPADRIVATARFSSEKRCE